MSTKRQSTLQSMPEIGTGKLVATVPKAIQHIWNARRKKRFKLPKIYGKDVSQAALPEGEGGAKDGGDSKTKDELKLERISACKGIGDQDLMHKYVGSLSSARFQKASASGTPESLFDIKGGSRGSSLNGRPFLSDYTFDIAGRSSGHSSVVVTRHRKSIVNELYKGRKYSKCPETRERSSTDYSPYEFESGPNFEHDEGDEWDTEHSNVHQRFHLMAQRVRTNIMWKKTFAITQEDDIDQSSAFVVKVDTDGKTEQLIFNAEQFKTNKRVSGRLTGRVREILCKAPAERTEEDVRRLQEVVYRLKCFDKYGLTLKKELTKVIEYDMYEDGRVILNQGDIATDFYFIVSGAVSVRIKLVDMLGRLVTRTVGELHEGATFGDLALIHNTKRQATIICKGDSEFLRINKSDYERVLRFTHFKEIHDRLKTFSWIPQFSSWTQHEIELTCRGSKLVDYPPNKVLQVKSMRSSENVNFVVSGECRLVRVVKLRKASDQYGRSVYHMAKLCKPHRQSCSKSRRPAVTVTEEKRLWVVGTLTRGHFFGVGERLSNTYIISRSATTCLVVPRLMFWRYGHMGILAQMREDLEASMPQDSDLSRLYWEAGRWERFKQRIVTEVHHHKCIPIPTQLVDVPRSIRDDSGEFINLALSAVQRQRARESETE